MMEFCSDPDRGPNPIANHDKMRKLSFRISFHFLSRLRDVSRKFLARFLCLGVWQSYARNRSPNLCVVDENSRLKYLAQHSATRGAHYNAGSSFYPPLVVTLCTDVQHHQSQVSFNTYYEQYNSHWPGSYFEVRHELEADKEWLVRAPFPLQAGVDLYCPNIQLSLIHI